VRPDQPAAASARGGVHGYLELVVGLGRNTHVGTWANAEAIATAVAVLVKPDTDAAFIMYASDYGGEASGELIIRSSIARITGSRRRL
jgi:hypothetical protein